MFTYEPTGEIRVIGCAGFNLKQNFFVLFNVGSKVYVKNKAKSGILESVVIKRLKREIDASHYKGYFPQIVYTDTTNRVWLERELLSEENAVDAAKAYWIRIEQEGRILFEERGCFPIPPEGC